MDTKNVPYWNNLPEGTTMSAESNPEGMVVVANCSSSSITVVTNSSPAITDHDNNLTEHKVGVPLFRMDKILKTCALIFSQSVDSKQVGTGIHLTK